MFDDDRPSDGEWESEFALAPAFLVEVITQLAGSGDEGAGTTGRSKATPVHATRRDRLMRILQQAATRSGHPAVGLQLGRRIAEPNLAVVGSMVTASRTLGDAHAHYEWLAERMGWGLAGRLEVVGGEAHYVMYPRPMEPIWEDFVVSLAFHSVLRFVGSALRDRGGPPPRVHAQFSGETPQHLADYEACFYGQVHFGAAWTGLRFSESLLHLARPGVDASLAPELRQIAGARMQPVEVSQVWTARVVRALGARGDFVDVDYATLAKRWSVSPRTLRRRLAKEGTTLSRLLDEVRLHRARNYLQHTPATTVAEIAQVLGYADETSFRRAFKRWTGESPQAYRAHHGGKKHEEMTAWTRDNPTIR